MPPPLTPGYGAYGYPRGSGSLTSGIRWQLLIWAVIPLVFALLPIAGLGIISSSIGLVNFGIRLRVPYLRKTGLIGIGLCLVALVIAIVKTTLVQPSIY